MDDRAESLAAIDPRDRFRILALLVGILLIALAGITFELIISTVSSYLLGNSVFQFSITIGLFMSSMGIGTFLSRYIKRRLVERFIMIELAVGVIGGAAAVILLGAFALGLVYSVLMVVLIVIVGTLVGLELPLLGRILKEFGSFRVVVANMLTWDYAGSLLGAVLFPLVLLPNLGLVQAGFATGIFNVLAGVLVACAYRRQLVGRRRRLWLGLVTVAAALIGAVFLAGAITRGIEGKLYQDQVLLTRQTPYQNIVLTKWRDDFRMFIDGNIQFSSKDEYRYHEALVHPAAAQLPSLRTVLVLGGGDGLVAREVYKYPGVERLTVVDLDPAVTELASSFPPLVTLNQRSLLDPRTEVVNDDAYSYLEQGEQRYDLIVIDLPDPNNESLAKLYSVEFYRLVARHLSASGLVAAQSTSPFFSRDAFWAIHRTMEAAGLAVRPYHTTVPSFGVWGFQLARLAKPPRQANANDRAQPPAFPERLPIETRYLTREAMEAMFSFPADMTEGEQTVSTLLNPHVLWYYLNSWKRWNQ